jgi:tetratricopeptide (TPR) repeat protein
MVYHSIGQPEQTLEYLSQALPFMEEVGDLASQAATLNNIGSLYYATRQWEQALEYFRQACPSG